MVPGGEMKFILIDITRELFVIARNGFQYYNPLVMHFQMIHFVV